MKTTRRLIFAAIPVFALAAIVDVFADSYPDRRITMVIPFPAGGPTDAIARPLAQEQPVIVENRVGGAGGTLGMRLDAMLSRSEAVNLDAYGRAASHLRRLFETLGLERRLKDVTRLIR
jgi:tripartite-type tricarboxylate transporter receptor subunit TctC